MKLLSLIVLLLFLCSNGQSYTMQRYTMDNRLPQNSIKDIVKDKYGFIWLSMEGQILRYDGSNFVRYKDFKLNNLSFGDFYGSINNDSMVVFNNSEKKNLLISRRQPKVISHKKESYPDGPSGTGIYKRLVKNNVTVRYVSFIDSYFVQLKTGIYYFENNSIIYVDRKSNQRIKLNLDFPRNRLKRLFVHGENIFVADSRNKKLLQLYRGKYSYVDAAAMYTDPETKIYWQQITGQVFMINHGKIYRSQFSEGKLSLTYLLEYMNIDKEISGAMFYDDAPRKLYIGSPINGLKILSLSDFSVSKKNLPYQDEVCYAALPFGENSVLTQEGIRYYNNRSEKLYKAPQSYDKRYIFWDDSGNLVYRENNSIHIRYKNTGFTKYDSISFDRKEIDGLYKNGGLYMVSVSDRNKFYLYIFDRDNFKKTERIIPCEDNIDTILRYNEDLLYLGGSNGIGVFSLSQNKIIERIGQNLPVKQIIKTKDGNIWLTTYNQGMYLLKDHKVIRIPADKNDFLANAHHILEDKNSNLWISSNNGLFKINKTKILRSLKAPQEPVTYYRYTKEHGFLNNEFNGSADPDANILEDGQFVFPSMEGFVFFTPQNVKAYFPAAHDLYVERAKVDGKMIRLKDDLLLECGYKNADIYIDIPYYSNLENIYLQAKLIGEENSQWINIKNDRKFRLSNTEPGKYQLLIRFLSSETGKFVYKSFPIEVEAYFYQTLSFKILVVGLIILIFVIGIQIRTNFLRLKNKVLENTLVHRDKELQETNNKLKSESDYQKKLVESISHDITTPVKFIALLSQELTQSDDAKTQKKYFDSIYKTSEQLYKFTLSLKEYTELYKQENNMKDEYQIYDLIETKKLLFEEIAAQKHTFIYNFCDHHLTVKTNKNILLAVFHNIIDNAVKNTSDGEIIITSASSEQYVEINIADTGSGMSAEQRTYYSELSRKKGSEHLIFKNYGLGLHMVIQLMMKINGEITFHENIPKGTLIKIHITL
ncbi:sensor histidine kinase [Chryseobacterium jejuense]|uniref:Signal transduction histidine kinase n=1 Tax=Chryseobacterium jejuense TaxID=445960 RepID=A0A2X2X5Z9_CHRJE|nr:HAMP domain-containing sensor histidine kinase [Chryseobacterium jejuense]SDJ58905.1 Signal transduction histidine kinase [Chryseobacterium jejuense]SQB46101.1 Virulence sensor protein BvgS precursor [Chryseobacterium jejuense]